MADHAGSITAGENIMASEPSDAEKPFISRVVLENYKSIVACDVQLRPLTFLIGPNGSGKSNFVDALHFLSDALSGAIDEALRARSGISNVYSRTADHPQHFGMRLEFNLPFGQSGHYAFRIAAIRGGGFEVVRESYKLQRRAEEGYLPSFFNVRDGRLDSNDTTLLAQVGTGPNRQVNRQSLILQGPWNLAAHEYSYLVRKLRSMRFYDINSATYRGPVAFNDAHYLNGDGSNIASVFEWMSSEDTESIQRIEKYLERIVPGVMSVSTVYSGKLPTLEFAIQKNGKTATFPASSMSAGTLRALGILVALFQANSGAGDDADTSLVGIEEPEVAIHPAAAGLLLDAMREASQTTQVIATTHSPDLLDSDAIDVASIIVVDTDRGVSQLTRLDDAARTMMRKRLYTAGQLLRTNQAQPDIKFGRAQIKTRPKLFDDE